MGELWGCACEAPCVRDASHRTIFQKRQRNSKSAYRFFARFLRLGLTRRVVVACTPCVLPAETLCMTLYTCNLHARCTSMGRLAPSRSKRDAAARRWVQRAARNVVTMVLTCEL